jgi:hypothetical protein
MHESEPNKTENSMDNTPPSSTVNEGEQNLNKEAADYYKEKYKNTKLGAVLASIISLAPISAVGAPSEWRDIGEHESFAQASKEYTSEKSDYLRQIEEQKQTIQRVQKKIDDIESLVTDKTADALSFFPEEQQMQVLADENFIQKYETYGDQAKDQGKLDFAYTFYLCAKGQAEDVMHKSAANVRRINENISAIAPKSAKEEAILAEHSKESNSITVTVPKNLTPEQKETLQHQMDEAARKMIEENHQ